MKDDQIVNLYWDRNEDAIHQTQMKMQFTRQITIDMFRKKNRLKRYASEYAISLDELGDSFSDGTTPEQELDAKLLMDTINRFLRTLPKDARNTFIGRYYFFDSLKDVARYCGMSEARAKSLLYRTRQSLKAYLVKEGFDL